MTTALRLFLAAGLLVLSSATFPSEWVLDELADYDIAYEDSYTYEPASHLKNVLVYISTVNFVSSNIALYAL